MSEPRIGSTGRAERVVTDALTAIALGSGDVPVFGTPAILALLEEACVDALRGSLPDGKTSVGVRAEIDHLAPSPVGSRVEATATLDGIEGRTLSFSAEARDGDTVVARMTHRRAIVDRARFGG